MKLKIGRIPYANLFPIFYMLEKECDCSSYEFIEGSPSELNKMLREGEIDVSPSSSIEYLRNQSLYRLIEGHSISSRGPVRSILLFSRLPVMELSGGIIHVSAQSETSVALLDIILRKFYGVQCRLCVSQRPEDMDSDAFLLIGDDALKQRSKVKGQGLRVYDLGGIWHERTGLPFVFALWIARKDIFEKSGLLNGFISDLNKAKETALKKFHDIAGHSPMNKFMSEDEIVSYWKDIDYGFKDDNKKGLELFGLYLKETAIIQP
jgi:chorismate dehydratase